MPFSRHQRYGQAMSIDKISDLLRKQRIVENIVHGQHAPRQDLVERVVQRQHVAELQVVLSRMTAREIADALTRLSLDEARQLWGRIEPGRLDEVSRELPGPLHQQIVSSEQAGKFEGQVNAFELVDGRLRQVAILCRKDLDGLHPLWIDLVGASAVERSFIASHFGVELPDPGETLDLEVSSRFHIEENQDIHLHSNFLLDREGSSRSVPVAFVLHGGMLFSVRNEELPVFRLQRRRARLQPGYVGDCHDLILDLYGADVEYSADSLEDIYVALGKVGHQVLSERMSDDEAAAILSEIAEQEDLNGRIRSNILDTQRALSFLMRSRTLSAEQLESTRQTLRDIESLNSHTAFLFDKINFLMDATIGFINVNQNQRINKLTVLGVVFMPVNIQGHRIRMT